MTNSHKVVDAKKGELLYEGKAKRVFVREGFPGEIIQEFKNQLTALNGQKKGEFSNKGLLNCKMTSLIFSYLAKHNISHHLLGTVGETGLVTKKLSMIPLEVVVRNRAAGSLAKKFGWQEGRVLKKPIVEFYYKDDALGDPFINEEQAIELGASTAHEMARLKSEGLLINDLLVPFFTRIDLTLIDFKLEFGRNERGEIILADEITPDTCRLWDLKSGEKMDKDRFRRDLGNVQETYEAVAARIQNTWGTEL